MKKLLFALCISILFGTTVKSQCSPNCTLYTCSSVAYSFTPVGGTSVVLGDDQLSGACNIGFTFSFMCTAYTQLYISSNGFISFNPACSQGCCSGGFCPTAGGNPNNYVAFSWTDLYPPGGGTITYQTLGVTPNRCCVITWNNIPWYCCGGSTTGQIRLYETTNFIEIISNSCLAVGNTKTQGIMNLSGSIGVPVPGRNASNWSASLSEYRFTIAGGGPTAPAAILGNTSICPGVATVYSVAPLGGATGYTWTLPGGWTGGSSTNTILATPGATGVLSVTATFTCGTSPVTTLNIVVNPNPTVTITGGTAAVCPGFSISLTGNGASTYTWNPGAIVGSPIVINPTISAQYTVIGTSAAGCTASAVQGITVNPSPTVTISGAAQICAGGTVFLTASGAGTYTWSTGSNNANITDTPTVNTTYSVVGFLGICSGSAIVTVTVNPLPVLSVAGNNTACAGSTLNLIASGANTYTWSTGALTAAMADTPTANITYTVFGSNTVTGCSSSTTFPVIVNAIPSVTITGPNAMCLGQNITLTGWGASSYSWSTGAPTQSIVVSPTANITYSLVGTSTLGCSGNPVIKNVTVNSIPVVNIAATEVIMCKGESATLTASGANTYSWNTGALTPSIVISPSVNTNYTVMGTNTTTGCYITTTISITVNLCTGFGNVIIGSANLSVHPNPNNGEFVIEFNTGLMKQIDVCDMMGRSILSTSTEEDRVEMNISNFADGIYYVKIQSSDIFKVVKIIKQ